MQRIRIALCLLVWNERAGCEADVPNLPLEEFDEVYAVDGGSIDGTVEYLESQGIPVHKQDARSYNAAYNTAFRLCECDYLVLFHPKGTISPACLKEFRGLFEKGNALVIASRMIKGSRNEEDDHLFKPRKWFVLLIALIAACLWKREGRIIWDVLHGVRGMKKASYLAINPLPVGTSIDYEMVIRSYKKRFQMVEFPIQEQRRGFGETHFKALPTGYKLLKYVCHELVRKG